MRSSSTLSVVAATALLGLTILASPAAGVTYNYDSPNFTAVDDPPYTTAMRITGSFEVAAPLPVSATTDLTALLLDFSFFDGVETRSLADSLICDFDVTTDAAGNITSWSIYVREPGPADPQHAIDAFPVTQQAGFITPNAGCGGGVLFPRGAVTGPGAAWTRDQSVLEIPTVSGVGAVTLAALLAIGALVLVRSRRRAHDG